MNRLQTYRAHLKPFLLFGISCGIIFFFTLGCHQTLKSSLPITTLKIDGHEITVEVANQEATREAGLMFRQHMDWDNGMLFVFDDTAQRYFWMKNTIIPLSIAFIDDKGAILNTLEMPPETEQTFPSKGPAKYALEMNAGWFTKNDVKEGDYVVGALTVPKGQ